MEDYDTVTLCHDELIRQSSFDLSSAPPYKIIKNDEADEGRITPMFFDLSLCDPYSTINASARKEREEQMNNIQGAKTDKYHWNTSYQRLIDLSFCGSRENIREEMKKLTQEFAEVVLNRSKIIIDELHSEQKTYYPSKIGGSLGGKKYIIDGILFKVAVPVIAGTSTDTTAKISAHELKSLESLIGCQIEKLYFPMLAVVDYKGYRVVGVSQLPVSDITLVSGSDNGGNDVKIPHGVNEEKLNYMCEKMNILPHEIVNDLNRKFKVYGPFDLEGHVGTDNKFYLLDFSRVLPPDFVKFSFNKGVLEALKKSNETETIEYASNAVHFCRLRPEFLRTLDTPLCSDAFSKYDVDKKYNIDQIEGAHSQLVERIQRSVKTKNGTFESSPEQLCNFDMFTRLAIEQLHKEGINLRYLGYLHHLFCVEGEEQNQNWIKFLRVEMVARVLLWIIRTLLRNADQQYQLDTVINELNILLCDETKSDYWERKIVPNLILRFHSFPADYALLSDIQKIVLFFQSPDNVHSLFLRVFDLIGIKVLHGFATTVPLDRDDFDLYIKTPKISSPKI